MEWWTQWPPWGSSFSLGWQYSSSEVPARVIQIPMTNLWQGRYFHEPSPLFPGFSEIYIIPLNGRRYLWWIPRPIPITSYRSDERLIWRKLRQSKDQHQTSHPGENGETLQLCCWDVFFRGAECGMFYWDIMNSTSWGCGSNGDLTIIGSNGNMIGRSYGIQLLGYNVGTSMRISWGYHDWGIDILSGYGIWGIY